MDGDEITTTVGLPPLASSSPASCSESDSEAESDSHPPRMSAKVGGCRGRWWWAALGSSRPALCERNDIKDWNGWQNKHRLTATIYNNSNNSDSDHNVVGKRLDRTGARWGGVVAAFAAAAAAARAASAVAVEETRRCREEGLAGAGPTESLDEEKDTELVSLWASLRCGDRVER